MKLILFFLLSISSFITSAELKMPSKLLIKIPTRSRPEQLFRYLDQYYEKLSGTIHCIFLISCDLNDVSMNNRQVIDRLRVYKNLYVYFGNNKTKIEAYNADINKHLDFDVLLVASDDMVPIVKGYDAIIIQKMKEIFPDFDGVLNFNDGHQGARLNTMPVIGKKYYKRFNYIYHPSYTSMWCDNELTEVSKKLCKEHVCDQVIIEHRHPFWGTACNDQLYAHNAQFAYHDMAIFERRKARSFDLNDLND